MGKLFFKSKTLWVNLLTIAAMIFQGQAGFAFSPETQAIALGVVNIGLRLITKEPVVVTEPK